MEYYIDRGVLGVSKEVSHTIFEYRGAPVPAHSRTKWDSQQNLVVPTMPPTLIGVCRLIQLYYALKVSGTGGSGASASSFSRVNILLSCASDFGFGLSLNLFN